MKTGLNICCLLLLLAGCVQKPYQQRLVEYINNPENKITQSIQAGQLKAIVKWLPYEYRNPVPAATQANFKKQDDGYYYFDIKFVKNSIDKPAKEKILYLDFDMQQDFRLYCAGDSLMPSICQKIENGRSGTYQYMVAFENRGNRLTENDFAVIYNDKIFGIGTLVFVYTQKDMRKIPGHKISTAQ